MQYQVRIVTVAQPFTAAFGVAVAQELSRELGRRVRAADLTTDYVSTVAPVGFVAYSYDVTGLVEEVARG